MREPRTLMDTVYSVCGQYSLCNYTALSTCAGQYATTPTVGSAGYATSPTYSPYSSAESTYHMMKGMAGVARPSPYSRHAEYPAYHPHAARMNGLYQRSAASGLGTYG